MTLEELGRVPRPRRCFVCGDPATTRGELTISRLPPEGSGKKRGKHLRTITRMLCDEHAAVYYRLMESPRRRPPTR